MLASGQRVKAGESLSPDLVDIYLSQLREDLTRDQCERILRPPPTRSHRTHRVRRREVSSDSDDSEGDYLSILSEPSELVSEVSSKHSVQYNVMNPDGSDSPMESPIQMDGGNCIYRREHLQSLLNYDSKGPLTTNPGYFRTPSAKTDHADVTMIDSRRPFISKGHVYPYDKVSFAALRLMLSDTVAHWRGGPRLEDIILWEHWSESFRRDFMARWRNQVADSVHHPHRRDGGYIKQFGEYDENHFASMSASHIIYPLFISLLPRRTDGTQPDSLYPTLEALCDDEIGHFSDKLAVYIRKGLYGYLAHLTIITDGWFAALSEIQHMGMFVEWWLNNGHIRTFPKSSTPDRNKNFVHALDKAYCKHHGPLNLYGLWQQWPCPLVHSKAHFSRLLRAKKAEAAVMATALSPLHGYMPLFLDLPKPPAHLLPKLSQTDTTVATVTPPVRRPSHPYKKSNLNAVSAQDQSESVLNTSSAASADTLQDGWYEPHDNHSAREPDKADIPGGSDTLVSQLTALISEIQIARSSASNPPSHNDGRPSYGDMRKQPSGHQRQAPEPTVNRACHAFFIDGTCPRAHECRYSHDTNVINEARLACMSRWKAGPSTVLSNLSVLDDAFPMDTGTGLAYSQDERNCVYAYVEETVAAAHAARLP